LSYLGSSRKRCNLHQFKLPLISVTVLASVDTGRREVTWAPYQILTYTQTPRSSYFLSGGHWNIFHLIFHRTSFLCFVQSRLHISFTANGQIYIRAFDTPPPTLSVATLMFAETLEDPNSSQEENK
jgi:hypothetical protein